MAKKRINKKKQMRQAAEYADKWIMARQKRHVNMIEKSVRVLQANIIDALQQLQATNGTLEGPKVNLKIAQKIHKQIVAEFGTQFDETTRGLIMQFDDVLGMVERQYRYLDEALEFAAVDRRALNALRDGYLDKWIELGGTKRGEITQAMYNHIVGREKFSKLVDVYRSALVGTTVKGVPGKSLAQYSRLYARDMLMNFHNETITTAAETLEIRHFLYVGDIMSTTRDFCRRRAGKVYTRKQIDSWTHPWAGKSGPAMTHRGGYNCRHHWQPVRPEWLGGEKKIDIANWDLEQREGG